MIKLDKKLHHDAAKVLREVRLKLADHLTSEQGFCLIVLEGYHEDLGPPDLLTTATPGPTGELHLKPKF